MPYRLGVDLGATFTAAAVTDGSEPMVIGLGNRGLQIPSVLFLKPDGEFLVGEAAERRGLTEPDRLARDFKRRFGDHVPIMVAGAPFSPQALTAHLLRWVVDAATERMGERPSQVVLTHPANWGPFRIELLDQVAVMAGVGPARLCTEPEAAVAQYAAQTWVNQGDRVAVYDLGGEAFDACVLEKTNSGFRTLGTPEGVEHLGGVDFDEAILRHVLTTLNVTNAPLDSDDPEVTIGLARLRRHSVEAKEALSTDLHIQVPVALPGLSTTVLITRAEFELMIRPALTETITAMTRALRNARVEPSELRIILLVGGSSRIPLVSELLNREFYVPTALDTHPEHDVALGSVRVGQVQNDVLAEAEKIFPPWTDPFEPGLAADSDSDGLSDVYEALKSLTDPLAADTDSDRLTDAQEVATGSDAGAIPGVAGAVGTGALAENEMAYHVAPSAPQSVGGDQFVDSHRSADTDTPVAVVDENVQFTVYRPNAVQPKVWYPLLAFAHLAERRADAPPGQPDPLEQVRALAAQAGVEPYGAPPHVDARGGVPRASQLTFSPSMEGVDFNPPSQTFEWQEDVHQQNFRLKARSSTEGRVLRGQLTVFLGAFILADIDLTFRVDIAAKPPPTPTVRPVTLHGTASPTSPEPKLTPVTAGPYHKIFASYSHNDLAIVRQIEVAVKSLGHFYLRDRLALRSGEQWEVRLLELIDQSDLFQLFWSSNSMRSEYVRREWEHALALGRPPGFIRPTYWEVPMPKSANPRLPPDELAVLHFHGFYEKEYRRQRLAGGVFLILAVLLGVLVGLLVVFLFRG